MTTESDPKKDVIYLDIEDDITAIIDKVKSSKSSIIALVPPKRVGVLQSTVSLQLLQRAAKSSSKRLVLITSNQPLMSLAGAAQIPVAKNLQSKPEVITTISNTGTEEVINGSDLSIGELNKTVASIESDEKKPKTPESLAAAVAARNKPKKGIAVPSFDTFRKKLFIGIGIGILFLLFLIWAIFFAGKATVSITANTNIANVDKTLQLRPDGKLDAKQGVVKPQVKEIKKAATTNFTPTGKKDVGEKASGTIRFSNSSRSSVEVPAGTVLASSSGNEYATDSSVTVPAATLSFDCQPANLCPGSASSAVTAVKSGANSNGATGTASGAPDGLSASFTSPTSGGTDKTVTVVSQADVDKAKDQLKEQKVDAVKAELRKEFDEGVVIINESYTVSPGEPTSSPGVDQEATTAKLTAETTYRLVGVSRSDLKRVFDAETKSQIAGEKEQKIYESGDKDVRFSQFESTESGFSVKAQATAQIGPNINEDQLSQQLVGKRAGEIQQEIEAIQGVEDVETTFSPFWVTKAPDQSEKIVIKFKLKND